MTELTCQQCGEVKESAKETKCPFAADVHGEEVDVVLCDECYHERCMDI